ncbi:MAG: hypothetical protein PHT40_04170 [Patescibacteria group bacterium]|nr:hypothetical protein [Patescibacteria group bacterium]
MNKNKILIILSLLGLGALARLIPHAPNFAPVAGIAIAASLCLNKKWSIILPITAMLISDLFIGFYDWKLMAVVYVSFGLIGIFSWWLKRHANFLNVVTTSLGASIFFFFSTNLAVWVFSAWYPKTWAGLMLCLEMGLPFFRNTLMGDLFYTAVLCGGIILVREMNKKRKLVKINN